MQPNIEMLARSATLHAVYETPQTLISISLIFAFSYLYQSDQEIDRTVALVILLVTVTSIIALNSNFYIALTLMIVELGLITALTLLQQAYYTTKNLIAAPILLLAIYPVYERINSYFYATDVIFIQYTNSAEAASEMYKSILLTSETFAISVLAILTWASIFIAVFIGSIGSATKLKSEKKTYKQIQSDQLVVFKRYTNETRSKLLNPNITVL